MDISVRLRLSHRDHNGERTQYGTTKINVNQHNKSAPSLTAENVLLLAMRMVKALPTLSLTSIGLPNRNVIAAIKASLAFDIVVEDHDINNRLNFTRTIYRNSSGDEIANVKFLRQHRTCRGQRLHPLNEFVISTKHATYLPIKLSFKMNWPVQPASDHKRTRPLLQGNMGVGNYSLKSTLLPPVVFPKYSLNNRADRN